ncbi:MAG: glycosyltransferase [Acidimicrobiales bacterium]
MRIDQFVPGFAKHDAIGNHVMQIRRSLRAAGFASDIYGEVIDSRLTAEARDYHDAPRSDPARVLLYHASTHSDMAAWLEDRAHEGQPLLCDYHNITPAAYFMRWEPDAARSMEQARVELRSLAPHTRLAMADSSFNAAELAEIGYTQTTVCPLLVDLDEYHQAPSGRTLERLRQARRIGGPHWLFVGRVAPNKCQHDVVAAFAVYRRIYEPGARLTLVGGATSIRYRRALEQLVADLELGGSVEILENLAFPDLLAYFAAADVFVCLSEHEGFCVPVLEAMELGVPVVAYAVAALPETLGAAGCLLDDKDPLVVAAAVHDILSSEDLRADLVGAGRARAGELSLESTSKHLVATLIGWLEARE